jgi:hypothetical protein
MFVMFESSVDEVRFCTIYLISLVYFTYRSSQILSFSLSIHKNMKINEINEINKINKIFTALAFNFFHLSNEEQGAMWSLFESNSLVAYFRLQAAFPQKLSAADLEEYLPCHGSLP